MAARSAATSPAGARQLAHHLAAIERRKAEREVRIASRAVDLPGQIHELRALAAATTDSEESIAINSAIIAQDARDVVALNRLGRGCFG